MSMAGMDVLTPQQLRICPDLPVLRRDVKQSADDRLTAHAAANPVG
jgi:hypothetical protein